MYFALKSMNSLHRIISNKKYQEYFIILLFSLLLLTTLISTAPHYLKTLYFYRITIERETLITIYAIRELLFWITFMFLASLIKSKNIIYLGLAISMFPVLVLIFNNDNFDILNTFIGFKITFLAWCMLNPNNEYKLDFINESFYKFVLFLLFSGLIIQTIHLFYGWGYNGRYLTLNLRNPSFFVSTTVSAYFLLVCYSYLCATKKNTVFNSLLVLVSLFLTNSTLGAMLTIVIFIDIFNKQKYKFTFSLLFYSLFMLAAHFIRLRINSKYFELTTGTRSELLKSAHSQSQSDAGLFSNFGNYSSLAAKYSAGGTEPDSLVTSLVGNLGFYYTLFFVITICLVFFFKVISIEFIKKHIKNFDFKNTKITLLVALATSISFSLVLNVPEINFVYILHFLTISIIFNELKSQNDINNLSLATKKSVVQ